MIALTPEDQVTLSYMRQQKSNALIQDAVRLIERLTAPKNPEAWLIELDDNLWVTDDLSTAKDDLTNHNATAIPLYR